MDVKELRSNDKSSQDLSNKFIKLKIDNICSSAVDDIINITELFDAYDAGGDKSQECTLILTEGLSAKSLAITGISSLETKNLYGVLPVKGKLLNVRASSINQLSFNDELMNITIALGLNKSPRHTYENLRYGHVMIMTDQDHDGFHIKGLIINFFSLFYPSLLKIPSFLSMFVTPIMKATCNKTKETLLFYTIPEYSTWWNTLDDNASSWSIKYYKGLGTNTSKEVIEYFQNLERHKIDFLSLTEQDKEALQLAFSNKKIEARKIWLQQYKPGIYLNLKEKSVSISDFIHKELILYSLANLRRSIPSMVDGLKPGQRKILFCSFKTDLTMEIEVVQFVGYILKHSAYHHGEHSLFGTIIAMARDFVGSNNINLLQPSGQFGTRNQGGQDHASARYLYTCLSPITRFLFLKEDDLILNYLNEHGRSVEPSWYLPIIPMVLVNGSAGIGTGWSSNIPNYNPKDIIANIRRLLRNEKLHSMDPWYKGFKGLIKKTSVGKVCASYKISGIIEEVDNTTLKITELPIGIWTQNYRKFLKGLMTVNAKLGEPFIKGYKDYSNDTSVYFEVALSEGNFNLARNIGLEKKFKLSSTMSTRNMYLYDSSGVIKKYDTPEQILQEFFELKMTYYEKHKKVYLDELQNTLQQIEVKIKKDDEMTMHYDSLDMTMNSMAKQQLKELCAEKNKLKNDIEDIPNYLWLKDLDALEKELYPVQINAVEVVQRLKINEESDDGGAIVFKQTPKKPMINNTDKLILVTESENIEDTVVKHTTKGRQNLSKTASSETDEDGELRDLKDRFGALNPFSPDNDGGMDADNKDFQMIEAVTGKEAVPKKRATPASKTLTIESEDAAFEMSSRQWSPNTLQSAKIVVDSPDKKVRKIRASPFNKKSGTFLNKRAGISSYNIDDVSASKTSKEVVQVEEFVARARPNKENKTIVVCVENQSEVDVDEVDNDDSLDYSEDEG